MIDHEMVCPAWQQRARFNLYNLRSRIWSENGLQALTFNVNTQCVSERLQRYVEPDEKGRKEGGVAGCLPKLFLTNRAVSAPSIWPAIIFARTRNNTLASSIPVPSPLGIPHTFFDMSSGERLAWYVFLAVFGSTRRPGLY